MTIDQLRKLLATILDAEKDLAVDGADELLFVRADLRHAAERLERAIKRKATDRPPTDGHHTPPVIPAISPRKGQIV